MRHFLTVLGLTVSCSTGLLAQTTVVTGRVVSADSGRPVVRSYFRAENLCFLRAQETDSVGDFAVTDLPPGTYKMWANTQGVWRHYESEERTVQLRAGDTVRLSFRMKLWTRPPLPTFAERDFPVGILHPTQDSTSPTGVYIPASLDDARRELEHLVPDTMKAVIRGLPEDDMGWFHHGFGTWLRNAWQLWGDSRLANYFRAIGVEHPDDMSGILLHVLWRDIHGQVPDVDRYIRRSREYWVRVASPDTVPFDGCTTGVGFMEWSGTEDSTGAWTITHIGKCLADDTWWAWEYGRGFFRPDCPPYRTTSFYDKHKD